MSALLRRPAITSCTTSPQQNKQCSFDFDLFWICCSAAVNHKIDHVNEPINRTENVMYICKNPQQIYNKSTTNRKAVQEVRKVPQILYTACCKHVVQVHI